MSTTVRSFIAMDLPASVVCRLEDAQQGLKALKLRAKWVKPENIHIYDSCHGADMLKKTPFAGLPEGCRMESLWGGMAAEVPLPPPWKEGSGKTRCTKSIAAGDVDILINIALCKGHAAQFGGFTMTMKNHFGTFDPRHGHDREDRKNSTDYLLSINRSAQVLGETGPGGEVLFPRQQLCFIDALWASRKGPGCESSAQPNRFFMGTCSPVLDYLAAVRFRRSRMKGKSSRGRSSGARTFFTRSNSRTRSWSTSSTTMGG